MNYQEMAAAVQDAKNTVDLADMYTEKMLYMTKGRLRCVSSTYQGWELLKALKKELSQFNAVTGKWKN